MQAVDDRIARLKELVARGTEEDAIERIKGELVALCRGPEGSVARERVEQAMHGALLELRWELEEIIERISPKKPAAKAPPPKEPEPDPQDDLVLVYDDPRGLLLHRSRKGDRWYATQVDPRTGQPATFELPAHQIDAVKKQLAGSPYWVLGAGA